MMKCIPGTTNISKCSAGYQIEKSIKGSRKYFGCFKTLIQALMYKDILVENNWDDSFIKVRLNPYRHIHRTSKGHYVIDRKIKGKTRYYGHFLSLEEAIEYRDFLETKGWSTNHRFVRNPNAGIYLNKCGKYEVFHYTGEHNEYFGCYSSLKEARRIKELCKKYDGDWDMIVEDTEIDYNPDGRLYDGSFFEKKDYRNDWFIIKNGGFK